MALGPPADTVPQDVAPRGSEGMDALAVLEDFASDLSIAAPRRGGRGRAAAQGPAGSCKMIDDSLFFNVPSKKQQMLLGCLWG